MWDGLSWSFPDPDDGYPVKNTSGTGKQNGWYQGTTDEVRSEAVDLTPYRGLTIQLAFWMVRNSDAVDYEGWYIDLPVIAEGSGSGTPSGGSGPSGGSTGTGTGTTEPADGGDPNKGAEPLEEEKG